MRTPRWLAMAISVCYLACSSPTHPLQRQIVGPVEVTGDAVTLALAEPLRAEFPESLVLLETSLAPGADTTPLDLAQQAGLEVTLVYATGAELPLQVGFVNHYVEASAPALHWPKGQPPFFSAVRLRAAHPMSFRRVLWFSYDPRKTKSGVMLPHEAARDSEGGAG